MTSKLKEARQKAGYRIEEVAEILKIRKQYIVSLEEEDFKKIPGQIYVDGYTKMYYELLGLEMVQKNNPVITRQLPSKGIEKFNKKYIILFSGCLLILVVLLYALLLELPIEQENHLEEESAQNTVNNHKINHNGNNEAVFNPDHTRDSSENR